MLLSQLLVGFQRHWALDADAMNRSFEGRFLLTCRPLINLLIMQTPLLPMCILRFLGLLSKILNLLRNPGGLSLGHGKGLKLMRLLLGHSLRRVARLDGEEGWLLLGLLVLVLFVPLHVLGLVTIFLPVPGFAHLEKLLVFSGHNRFLVTSNVQIDFFTLD